MLGSYKPLVLIARRRVALMKTKRTISAIVTVLFLMSLFVNTIAASTQPPRVSGTNGNDAASGTGSYSKPLPPDPGKGEGSGGVLPAPTPEGGNGSATPVEEKVKPTSTPDRKSGKPTATPIEGGGKAEEPGPSGEPSGAPAVPAVPGVRCSPGMTMSVDGFYSIGTITICSATNAHITHIDDYFTCAAGGCPGQQ